ncbi:MAG: AraC family transcriptional regulator [Candidatus Pacebacteria bacterium]|nr:AraC family transcriptional regulator [Candidatus Paceibacterota bacterium]
MGLRNQAENGVYPHWLSDEVGDMLRQPFQWRLGGGDFPSDFERETNVPEARRLWSRRHRHCHNYAECLLALRGDCLYGMLDDLYLCRPWTALYFPPGCNHDDNYPEEVHGIQHLWLRFLDDGMVTNLFERHESGDAVNVDGRVFLHYSELGVVPAVLAANSDFIEPVCRRERIRLLIAAALLKLVEGGTLPVEHVGSQFQEQVMESIVRHIRSTGGRGLSLDSLATLAGYSKFHFHRMFKQYTGSTVQQFVDDARWLYYQQRKQDGCMQKEIAEELGFSSPSSFSRWLKNISHQNRITTIS